MDATCKRCWRVAALACLFTAACSAPAGAQRITLRVLSPVRAVAGDSTNARLTFIATTRDGRPWSGSPDSLTQHIRMTYGSDDDRATRYATHAPSIIANSEVRVVLVLAVDVSGSMGYPPENYAERMEPLQRALLSFLHESSKRSNLWVRLVPFGEVLPYELKGYVQSGDPTEWEGRYLAPSRPADAALLDKAVEQIAEFVKVSHERHEKTGQVVDTGLWCAVDEGISIVRKVTGDPSSEFAGAAGALVLLTDGRNDLGVHANEGQCASYDQITMLKSSVDVLAERHRLPAVRVIAFGSEAQAGADTIETAFSAAPQVAKVEAVATGAAASDEIDRVYNAVWENMSSLWYVDLRLPKDADTSPPGISPVPEHGSAEVDSTKTPPRRIVTLFMPSPLGEMRTRGRLLAIGVGGLVLLALTSAWNIFRFRQRGSARPEPSPPIPHRAPEPPQGGDEGRGISVQEWTRRQAAKSKRSGDNDPQGGSS